jgi:3,4-dihydroxy 2-butanone 4-phosphate synthase/GTP cyclohydrolase II
MPLKSISPISDIIAEIKAGKIVILVDDESRENEGDFVIAAEFATAEYINFMAKFGRGLICLTLSEAHCKQLNLPPMVQKNGTRLGTNFTVSIEAATGVTTGISAKDRATTIKAAVAKDATPKSIISPGHIFPLTALNGGVLVRAGHTEAGCDLAALAGMQPASVICEILKDDGEMARLPDLVEIAQKHFDAQGRRRHLDHGAHFQRAKHQTACIKLCTRLVEQRQGLFDFTRMRQHRDEQVHLPMRCGAQDGAQLR